MAVNERSLSAAEARAGKLHVQAIVLEAFGKLGSQLLKQHPNDWQKKLAPLEQVDWQRSAAH
jgi:DNA sulfur modification protein DndB